MTVRQAPLSKQPTVPLPPQLLLCRDEVGVAVRVMRQDEVTERMLGSGRSDGDAGDVSEAPCTVMYTVTLGYGWLCWDLRRDGIVLM